MVDSPHTKYQKCGFSLFQHYIITDLLVLKIINNSIKLNQTFSSCPIVLRLFHWAIKLFLTSENIHVETLPHLVINFVIKLTSLTTTKSTHSTLAALIYVKSFIFKEAARQILSVAKIAF